MYNGDVDYAVEEAQKLIGYKVTGVCRDRENDSYGLVLQRDGEKKLCWVDCDPEGNGPGWLSVEAG